MQSLSIAATGMEAQQSKVEVISNNLANMNTSSFKRSRIAFQDILYQNLRHGGADAGGYVVPVGINLGIGVKVAAIYRVHDQGSLKKTDNNLDIAISGKGYFGLSVPGSVTHYTRDGSFSLSPQGTIVNHDGYPLVPSITVPSGSQSVSINDMGLVQVRIDGEMRTVGQISLSVFPNEVGLIPMGRNAYSASSSSGQAVPGPPGSNGMGSLQQGYLEESNVKPIQEVTELISAQRAYEMNSKVISISSQMMSKMNQS